MLSKLAGKMRALPWVFWLIAVPGWVLPWAIGVGVKLYAQAQGRPTIPWSHFVDPGALLFEIPLSIFWATPHIALGLVATPILQGRIACLHWASHLERVCILGAAFVCGTVGLVAVFIDGFWNFDGSLLFASLPVSFFMAVGFVLGCAIAGVSAGVKRLSKKRGLP